MKQVRRQENHMMIELLNLRYFQYLLYLLYIQLTEGAVTLLGRVDIRQIVIRKGDSRSFKT